MGHYDDDAPYVVIERNDGGVGTFLVGLAIGAGLAVLFAPQSGRETRRRIRTGAERAGHAAVGLAQDVTDSVADTFQDARQRVEERIDSARHAIEVKRRQVTRAMEAGRVAAQEARDELERRLAETKAAYQAGAEVARHPRAVTASRAPRAVTREAGATEGATGATTAGNAAGVSDVGEGGVEL